MPTSKDTTGGTMFKIQVRATDRNQAIHAPAELRQWRDMEGMPELPNKWDADQWLIENEAAKLEAFGIEFRIVQI